MDIGARKHKLTIELGSRGDPEFSSQGTTKSSVKLAHGLLAITNAALLTYDLFAIAVAGK